MPQDILLLNTGTAPLQIGQVEATAPFAATHTCPAHLAPGQQCQIAVTFNPAQTGLQHGTLSLMSNTASSPHTVTLQGRGVSPSTGTSTVTPIVSPTPSNESAAAESSTNDQIANDTPSADTTDSGTVPDTATTDDNSTNETPSDEGVTNDQGNAEAPNDTTVPDEASTNDQDNADIPSDEVTNDDPVAEPPTDEDEQTNGAPDLHLSIRPLRATVQTKVQGLAAANILVAAGSTQQYVVEYANRGNGAATDVAVQIALPDYTHFNAVSSDPHWQDNQRECLATIGRLEAGASHRSIVSLDIASDIPAGQTIQLYGRIRGNDTNGTESATQTEAASSITTQVRWFSRYLPMLSR